MSIPPFGTAVALAIAIALPAGAFPATATTIKATAAQLLAVGARAESQGDDKLARNIYQALQQDPAADVRLEARFRLALMESRQGHLTAAALLLRGIVDERPSATRARLELARLLDRMGDKEGAWRQVRAIRTGALPSSVARLVDRYSEALRSQRRSGASFEFALAPDSNINRATRSDTLGTVLGDFQIADDAKARSGVGAALSGTLYRRWAIGHDASLLARVAGSANLYRESDFNDIGLDAAAGPEFGVGKGRLATELGVTQRWFGQKPYVRAARVGATLSMPIGAVTALRLGGSAALIDNQVSDLQDGHSLAAQMSLERALSATTGAALNLSLDRQALKEPAYATTGWRAGLTGWRDLGRMTVTVNGEIGRLHADDRLALLPDKRRDRYRRFGIGMAFRQLQVAGFAPVARLSIERNHSSVAFYRYARTRTEIGVVRAF